MQLPTLPDAGCHVQVHLEPSAGFGFAGKLEHDDRSDHLSGIVQDCARLKDVTVLGGLACTNDVCFSHRHASLKGVLVFAIPGHQHELHGSSVLESPAFDTTQRT
jgi:hypothetical protein